MKNSNPKSKVRHSYGFRVHLNISGKFALCANTHSVRVKVCALSLFFLFDLSLSFLYPPPFYFFLKDRWSETPTAKSEFLIQPNTPPHHVWWGEVRGQAWGGRGHASACPPPATWLLLPCLWHIFRAGNWLAAAMELLHHSEALLALQAKQQFQPSQPWRAPH